MRAIFFENDFIQLINNSKQVESDDIDSRVIRYVPNKLSTVSDNIKEEIEIFPTEILIGEFTFKRNFLFLVTNETYIKIKKVCDSHIITNVEITVNSKELYINIDYKHDHHIKSNIFILPEINHIQV